MHVFFNGGTIFYDNFYRQNTFYSNMYFCQGYLFTKSASLTIHYLRAPEVNPLTKKRWTSKTMKIMGIMLTVVRAAI